MFLFLIVDEYMSFFATYKSEFDVKDNPKRNPQDVANSPELVRIRKFFNDHKNDLTEEHALYQHVLKLMPKGDVDKAKLVNDFFPQFLLFALRIFDIYDSAMSGLTVEETLELMKHQQAEKKAGVGAHRAEPKSEEDAIKSALGEKMLGQFGKPSFWQHRYDGITADFKPHDWYVSWGTIKERIWQITGLGLPSSDIKSGKKASDMPDMKSLKVLNLGCGNSLVAEALCDDLAVKIEKVVSTDFVESVVKAQNDRVKNTKYESKCVFTTLNVLEMDKELKEGEFDFIIDKGTMDSLLTTSTATIDFTEACKQISRVLKPGGWFVMVSCAIGINQIKPLQNLTLFKWKVAHVSEMPSDVNQETKINMLVIKRLDDKELQAAIEESLKKNAPASPSSTSSGSASASEASK